MRRTLALLLCLLLTLTGCASSPAAESTVPEEETPGAAEPETPAEPETAEPEMPQQPEAPEAESQEALSQETEEAPEAVQVSIVDTGVTYTHEDGTKLAEIQSQDITVTVPGKPEVEESINADLRNLLEDSNQSDQVLANAAKEDYSLAPEEAMEWSPYQSSLQAEVTRCDGQVLSLRFHVYEYAGGMHGYGSSYGRSYDLASGSRLTLDFMSAQGASLRDTALEQIQALCQTEDYADLLYAKGYYEEFLPDIVQNNHFYLDEEGIVFLAEPYLIGPYASGTIEFHLPYSGLEGVLKENYLPAA